MKIALLLAFFLSLCPILHGTYANPPEPPDGGCWVKEYMMGPRKVIRCAKVGIDGRSFEQAIGDGSIPLYTYDPGYFANIGTYVPLSDWYFKNVTILEIADLVGVIVLADSHNVTIGVNALSRFVNLTELKIWGPSVSQGERARLNLAPGALRRATRLDQMEISRMDISDESIRELLHLRERLISILVVDISPEDKVLASLAQFTALQYMGFFNCSTRPFPVNVTKRSAAVLNTIEINNCYFPRLENNAFTNASRLTRIFLKQTNLSEVQARAFDQNPELVVVNLSNNDLPSLPDGLFSKLTKLWSVVLTGNPRLIGSIDKSNFSHVQEFQHFRFRLL